MNLDRSTSHSARPARVLLLLALGVCFLIAAGGRPATPAQAAFPGQNGKIAFTSYRDGNAEIYVMEPDGSNETRLTFNEASDAEPAWSPDGTRIAFESDRDGDSEIFVMNADGSEQTQLTFNSLGDAGATWSPDGNRIAFHSGGGGVNFDVYVMDYDGSNILPLTSDPALDGFPNWSPDGSKVAFHSNRDGNFEIYVMNADGSNETNLTQHPGYDVDPSWSPDGTQIAFESVRPPAANSEIYVMWADGSSPVNISGHSGNDLDPAWSPSGFEIVFETDRDGNRDIYVMWPDGDNPMSLTGDPAHDQHPDWQTIPSDGGKISIIQQVKPAGTTGPAPWEFDGDLGVFSIEAEGGGVVVENLSSGEYTISQAKVDGFGQAVNCDSGEFGALEVTLQLDIQESVTCTFRATKVMTGAGPTVFSSNRDGDPDIYLLDPSAKTDELIQLTDAPGADTEPVLSAGGTFIVFTSERDGKPEIYSMDIDGAFPTRLTYAVAGQRRRASISPDGQEIAYESDETGNSEIYTMPLISRVPVRVTNHLARDRDPVWVPGPQRRLVYTSDRDGNEELYDIDLAVPAQPRRLTVNPGVDYAPTLSRSPVAPVVVYSCQPDGSLTSFFMCSLPVDPGARAITAGPIILTDAPGVNYPLDWSLDGTRITFSSTRDGDADIYTMTPDGGNETQLTDDPAGDGVADSGPLPPGDITIQAAVVGSAPAADRQFGGDLGSFSLPATGSITFEQKPPGNYWLTEANVPGYSQTISCNGAITSGAVFLTLEPAQAVTCNFTLTADGVELSYRQFVPMTR